MIFYPPALISELLHSDLFIDTNTFIGAISYPEIFDTFLLIACLYKFPKSFLITANHKDCPLDILDRKFVVTVDTDKDIKNYGIYQFSMEKFNKAAEKILKS